jgi:hypothetical protein
MTSTEYFGESSKSDSYDCEPRTGHRLRTRDCLSIPKLVAGRFSADQRAHIKNCAYCNKVLEMSKPSWFSNVRTWARIYADSHTAVMAMRFVYVAALVAVMGLSIVSQKEIGRLQGSQQILGAQQAGIGIGLQELRASLSEPASYRDAPRLGDEKMVAFSMQQRELANENQRLHQDLVAEQRQIKALVEVNDGLRSELSDVALELSSYQPTTTSLDSSLALNGNLPTQHTLLPDNHKLSITDLTTKEGLIRWTIFKLSKTSNGTNELSWIALPAGKDDSIAIEESKKESLVTATVPSVAVFTRALTSMPIEIKGEPEGNGIRVHAIRFLPEGKTSARPTMDPGIVISVK